MAKAKATAKAKTPKPKRAKALSTRIKATDYQKPRRNGRAKSA